MTNTAITLRRIVSMTISSYLEQGRKWGLTEVQSEAAVVEAIKDAIGPSGWKLIKGRKKKAGRRK